MKKIVAFSLFIFLAGIIGIFIFGLVSPENSPQTNTASQSSSNASLSTGNSATNNSVLSSAEIAKHNSASDCWLIIENKVYDVTSYLYSHPGGPDIILRHCGQESTQAFNTKDSLIAKAHSAIAHQLLANYYIGELNQARVK